MHKCFMDINSLKYHKDTSASFYNGKIQTLLKEFMQLDQDHIGLGGTVGLELRLA